MNRTTDIAEYKTSTGRDMAVAAPVVTRDVGLAAPTSDSTPVPAVTSSPRKKPKGGFDAFVAKVRDVSPAWVVNNGSRLCLAFKGGADGLSIWSSVAKGRKSPWRLAASIVTMAGEIAGMIYPEKDISDERREGYRRMSPWKFFVTKTKEALNPKDYITETTGLALIVNGVLMSMSGVYQSSKEKKSWEILNGMMTSVAGVIMTYWPDRERAWQLAHSTFMVRSVPAAFQAYDAYYKGNPTADPPVEPGDWQTGAKWVLNQIANVLGTLYGGVKKNPDGSIVHIGKRGEDTTAPRQSRKLVAARPPIEPEHAVTKVVEEQPTTVITNPVIAEHEAARKQVVTL